MRPRAVIFGCAGPELLQSERAFFSGADPWGFILFARNIESPAQLLRLTSDLRDAVGRDAPVLVDQEGGRVARMRAPDWREWTPALEECERLPGPDLRARAMYLRYRLIAAELVSVGIDVNCAPVLDVVHARTHPVLRNRCYGRDPSDVARIGRAVAEGLLAGGVLPVMKHMPGQGRADLDSHADLPVVSATPAELAREFAPFRDLADLPIGMTAHVVYSKLDPEAPGTLSARVNSAIRADIGFGGLLLTDDLSMRALKGAFAERAERALAAGCDVILHCNGDAEEMSEIASAVPRLDGASARRADAALARRGHGAGADAAALEAEMRTLRESVASA